jgi:hypothetical protein
MPIAPIDPLVVLRDFPVRALSAPLTLGPKRRAALAELLDYINADKDWQHLRHVAYTLATVRHETGGTFKPIKEWRAPEGTAHRKLQDRYWHTGFYGRGFVQLTWDWNYRKAGQKLAGQWLGGVQIHADTLEQHPDFLLRPAISYAVLARGLREGWFTGKKLGDYITETATDYVRARRCVNGNDRAQMIATYAQEFELMLRAGSRPVEVAA